MIRRSLTSTPQRLIVTMWAVITAAGVLLSLLPPAEPVAAMKQAVTSACGVCISFAVTRLAASALLRPSRPAYAALTAVTGAAGTTLWLLDSLLQELGGANPLSVGTLLERRYNWVFFTLLFGLQILVLALVSSTRSLAAQQGRLVEAQLAALRLQINPHFLFNTLNALAAQIEEQDREGAGKMIERLALFLRTTLSEEGQPCVPLAAELDTIQAYLAIEEVRLGERLQVGYEVSEESKDVLIPSLLLQPLVENAIKHAVAPSIDGATITIRAHVSNGALAVSVEDRLASERSRRRVGGLGKGLKNVQARLEAQYGPDGLLETTSVPAGFIAALRLPARYARKERAA